MQPSLSVSRLAIDKAVVFGLAARLWQLLAGPVTAVLITSLFSPDLQGYYYTFANLLALQAFVELGLHAIVIYFVSHDWSQLKLDESGEITGDKDSLSRLVTFGRKLFRWYAGVAALFVLIMCPTGIVFFWPGEVDIAWIQQWLVLVIVTAGSLWLIPFLAILEGCNQVETVNRFRFWLVVAGNIAVWTCLIQGAELWTLVASAGVRLFGELFLIGGVYRKFFACFRKPFREIPFPWKEEVWPMQWRSAVQSVAGYFGLAFATPVIFSFHGPALAGQLGLTLTVLIALQGVGQAWIQPKVPTIGMLISQRKFSTLNQLFRRVVLVSAVIVFLGVCAFASFVWGLATWRQEIAESAILSDVSGVLGHLRAGVIDPLPILVFGVGLTCHHVATCLGIYIRAHKRDPLVVLSTASSVLIGLLIYLLGRYFAVTGAALGYCGVYLLVVIPGHLLFFRRVVAQHNSPPETGLSQ